MGISFGSRSLGRNPFRRITNTSNWHLSQIASWSRDHMVADSWLWNHLVACVMIPALIEVLKSCVIKLLLPATYSLGNTYNRVYNHDNHNIHQWIIFSDLARSSCMHHKGNYTDRVPPLAGELHEDALLTGVRLRRGRGGPSVRSSVRDLLVETSGGSDPSWGLTVPSTVRFRVRPLCLTSLTSSIMWLFIQCNRIWIEHPGH